MLSGVGSVILAILVFVVVSKTVMLLLPQYIPNIYLPLFVIETLEMWLPEKPAVRFLIIESVDASTSIENLPAM